eukprot:GHVL01019146.1.p1 GENE.GHVL01019146.1~~GHVL01019146.1.p1  ORF type:complete len:726 (-),score=107.30 GHVL01019146.1:2997-5174(-)
MRSALSNAVRIASGWLGSGPEDLENMDHDEEYPKVVKNNSLNGELCFVAETSASDSFATELYPTSNGVNFESHQISKTLHSNALDQNFETDSKRPDILLSMLSQSSFFADDVEKRRGTKSNLANDQQDEIEKGAEWARWLQHKLPEWQSRIEPKQLFIGNENCPDENGPQPPDLSKNIHVIAEVNQRKHQTVDYLSKYPNTCSNSSNIHVNEHQLFNLTPPPGFEAIPSNNSGCSALVDATSCFHSSYNSIPQSDASVNTLNHNCYVTTSQFMKSNRRISQSEYVKSVIGQRSSYCVNRCSVQDGLDISSSVGRLDTKPRIQNQRHQSTCVYQPLIKNIHCSSPECYDDFWFSTSALVGYSSNGNDLRKRSGAVSKNDRCKQPTLNRRSTVAGNNSSSIPTANCDLGQMASTSRTKKKKRSKLSAQKRAVERERSEVPSTSFDDEVNMGCMPESGYERSQRTKSKAAVKSFIFHSISPEMMQRFQELRDSHHRAHVERMRAKVDRTNSSSRTWLHVHDEATGEASKLKPQGISMSRHLARCTAHYMSEDEAVGTGWVRPAAVHVYPPQIRPSEQEDSGLDSDIKYTYSKALESYPAKPREYVQGRLSLKLDRLSAELSAEVASTEKLRHQLSRELLSASCPIRVEKKLDSNGTVLSDKFLVAGFNEVSHRIADFKQTCLCIVLAHDAEGTSVEGKLKRQLESIKKNCEIRQIPIIYAMTREQLGL